MRYLMGLLQIIFEQKDEHLSKLLPLSLYGGIYFLQFFECLTLWSSFIKIIKNGNLLYKVDLFYKLGRASDVTKKETLKITFL